MADADEMIVFGGCRGDGEFFNSEAGFRVDGNGVAGHSCYFCIWREVVRELTAPSAVLITTCWAGCDTHVREMRMRFR